MKKIAVISGVVVTIGLIIALVFKNTDKPIQTDTNLQPNVATNSKPIQNNIGQNQVPANTIIFNNNITPPDSASNKFPAIVPPNINSSIASPDGSLNKFPPIVRPNANIVPSKIGPPPEANLMRECQINAKGNFELVRKCFEAKLSANVAKVQIPNTVDANGYINKLNTKTNYCKNKVGNNEAAFKFCMNTEEAQVDNTSQAAQFMQAKQAEPSTNQNPVAQNNQVKNTNNYSIYK